MFKTYAFCPTCEVWKVFEVTETSTRHGFIAYCSASDHEHRATFFGDEKIAHLSDGLYVGRSTRWGLPGVPNDGN